MMFPMLNSLKLEFYVCYFGQLMHFLSIKRFLMDYTIGCDSRSLCEIASSHNIRSLDYCSCTEFVKVHLEVELN